MSHDIWIFYRLLLLEILKLRNKLKAENQTKPNKHLNNLGSKVEGLSIQKLHISETSNALVVIKLFPFVLAHFS
jgi:hypothetical protein